jgi:hypothetical protein
MIQVNSSVQILSIVVSFALAGFVVWLISRGRLREETALWWLAAAAALLLFALRRDLLEWTAAALGIFYPPSVLLLGIVFAGTLLALHFSVSLSDLNVQNKRLAQELALLAQRIDDQEAHARGVAAAAGSARPMADASADFSHTGGNRAQRRLAPSAGAAAEQ